MVQRRSHARSRHHTDLAARAEASSPCNVSAGLPVRRVHPRAAGRDRLSPCRRNPCIAAEAEAAIRELRRAHPRFPPCLLSRGSSSGRNPSPRPKSKGSSSAFVSSPARRRVGKVVSERLGHRFRGSDPRHLLPRSTGDAGAGDGAARRSPQRVSVMTARTGTLSGAGTP
jgi:hypothetical protein